MFEVCGSRARLLWNSGVELLTCSTRLMCTLYIVNVSFFFVRCGAIDGFV